jgi:hypothetical protein
MTYLNSPSKTAEPPPENPRRVEAEEHLEAEFHEARAQLAFLKARVETVRPDVQAEYCGHIETLNRLHDVGLGRLFALRTAPDEFWEQLVEGVQLNCSDLKAEMSTTRLKYFPNLS